MIMFNRKLTISKDGEVFLVEDKTIPGSPPVGRGETMMEAIGSWFHRNQNDIGLEFEVDDSAWADEQARRRHEISSR